MGRPRTDQAAWDAALSLARDLIDHPGFGWLRRVPLVYTARTVQRLAAAGWTAADVADQADTRLAAAGAGRYWTPPDVPKRALGWLKWLLAGADPAHPPRQAAHAEAAARSTMAQARTVERAAAAAQADRLAAAAGAGRDAARVQARRARGRVTAVHHRPGRQRADAARAQLVNQALTHPATSAAADDAAVSPAAVAWLTCVACRTAGADVAPRPSIPGGVALPLHARCVF